MISNITFVLIKHIECNDVRKEHLGFFWPQLLTFWLTNPSQNHIQRIVYALFSEFSVNIGSLLRVLEDRENRQNACPKLSDTPSNADIISVSPKRKIRKAKDCFVIFGKILKTAEKPRSKRVLVNNNSMSVDRTQINNNWLCLHTFVPNFFHALGLRRVFVICRNWIVWWCNSHYQCPL